jgi:uncharacterized membrane protein
MFLFEPRISHDSPLSIYYYVGILGTHFGYLFFVCFLYLLLFIIILFFKYERFVAKHSLEVAQYTQKKDKNKNENKFTTNVGHLTIHKSDDCHS